MMQVLFCVSTQRRCSPPLLLGKLLIDMLLSAEGVEQSDALMRPVNSVARNFMICQRAEPPRVCRRPIGLS